MRGLKSAPWIAMLAVLGACAEDSPSAVVQGVLPLDADCEFEAAQAQEGGGGTLVRGLLDLSPLCGRPSYFAGLLVENQLINRGSPTGARPPVRADPNTLRINGAEVELQAQGGEALPFDAFDSSLPNPFSVATTAVIPSAEEDEPGQGTADVEMIPQRYVDAMREAVGPGAGGVVVASVRLFGETAGGVDVDVATFEYPIQLCSGCLVRCREQILNVQRVGDQFDSQCHNHPGVNDSFCVTDQNVRPECARFDEM